MKCALCLEEINLNNYYVIRVYSVRKMLWGREIEYYYCLRCIKALRDRNESLRVNLGVI